MRMHRLSPRVYNEEPLGRLKEMHHVKTDHRTRHQLVRLETELRLHRDLLTSEWLPLHKLMDLGMTRELRDQDPRVQVLKVLVHRDK